MLVSRCLNQRTAAEKNTSPGSDPAQSIFRILKTMNCVAMNETPEPEPARYEQIQS
jgi:hypothetical protein